MNNYGSHALVEVYIDEVPEELKGIKIKDSHLSDQYHITIGIIKRKDNYILSNAETIIEEGDTIMMFGPYNSIKVLFKNDKPQ